MDKNDQTSAPSDDELLNAAIPIDELEDDAEGIPSEGIELSDDEPPSGREIRTFGPTQRHEEQWNRTPNTTGQGAIHVRTFVAKLRLDAIEHMDQQVNEWLDANPQYEVKFVTSAVGELLGKTKEAAVFLSVWV